MNTKDEEYVTLEHFFAMFYSNYDSDIKMLKEYTELYKQMESGEVINILIDQLNDFELCVESGIFKDILDHYGNKMKVEDFRKNIKGLLEDLSR
ncbi:hypothetical protein [Paenibacillus polymyxa]|uniref:hypothetical protein n=1 Tax=Paenibacillus polymyxa TaxID=1406 RepID=UPI002AB3B7AB|nr:hypothetical protein [Paenibacillus polymyxa]MDY8021983.1 hypothetical protein [Paenibacillus polymyxa]